MGDEIADVGGQIGELALERLTAVAGVHEQGDGTAREAARAPVHARHDVGLLFF